MEQTKKELLESKGWKIGTVSDFLELTPEESIFVEIKLALSNSLKNRRQKTMTQSELASLRISSAPGNSFKFITLPPLSYIQNLR
jgi:hypothetical protein